LEAYLDEYIAAAGIQDDKEGPLFRTTGRSTGRSSSDDATGRLPNDSTARARQADRRIGNHSMHATGITDYLKSDGTLEHAQNMAAHSSPRTTKLYNRRNDEAALDEYERVRI
jgi:hypothetical protein